ncbi:hypothetical protein, partial [Streptococcus pneumoniae]|uniref:hypothetical protein n=1 Tax=Streptococcus pneumoniae TaxID=1313 RepID=UPI001D0C2E1B
PNSRLTRLFFCCAESRPDSDLPFYKISENKDIDLLFICLTIKQKDIWGRSGCERKINKSAYR